LAGSGSAAKVNGIASDPAWLPHNNLVGDAIIPRQPLQEIHENDLRFILEPRNRDSARNAAHARHKLIGNDFNAAAAESITILE